MDLIYYVDETLRRWPRPLPAPALSWWPAWAMRSADAMRELTASVVAAHRSRALRRRMRQELEHLDDRMLMDIGFQPGDVRCVQSVDLWQSLPIPFAIGRT